MRTDGQTDRHNEFNSRFSQVLRTPLKLERFQHSFTPPLSSKGQ